MLPLASQSVLFEGAWSAARITSQKQHVHPFFEQRALKLGRQGPLRRVCAYRPLAARLAWQTAAWLGRRPDLRVGRSP